MLSSIVTKLALATALVAGACASPDTATAFCQRAQDCNDLNVGYSVQDCIDVVHQCVGQLTQSEQDDWYREAEGCISDDSCQLFGSCFTGLPWCN